MKPGAESEYADLETRMAVTCARRGCPNAYLALAVLSAPLEVWWFVAMASDADVDAINEAWARNTELMAALKELSDKKRDLAEPSTATMTTHRIDLSDGSSWNVGELPFVVVCRVDSGRRGAGSVFEAEDGSMYGIAAAATRAAAEALASAADGDARVFEVRPAWSFPRPEWVESNPELWASAR